MADSMGRILWILVIFGGKLTWNSSCNQCERMKDKEESRMMLSFLVIGTGRRRVNPEGGLDLGVFS